MGEPASCLELLQEMHSPLPALRGTDSAGASEVIQVEGGSLRELSA